MKRVIFGLITVLVVVVLVYLIPTTRIDLTKYETSIDYGSLNSDQIMVMDTILLCGTTGLTIIEHDLSYEEYELVIMNLSEKNIYFKHSGKSINSKCIKSITYPRLTLSIRFPNAPDTKNINTYFTHLYLFISTTLYIILKHNNNIIDVNIKNIGILP